jgi:hypothetical protein
MSSILTLGRKTFVITIALVFLVGIIAAHAGLFQICNTGTTYLLMSPSVVCQTSPCVGEMCGAYYVDSACTWTFLPFNCNPNTCNASWWVKDAVCSPVITGCICN